MTTQSVPYALFTKAEMERRYARAQALMAERGIDALLISGEENFKYFAGTSSTIASHYSLARPQLFILPCEGDPIIYTQYVDTIELSTYVPEIRRLHVGAPVPARPDPGRAQGGGRGPRPDRRGAGAGAADGHARRRLPGSRRALPDGEFVDAADIIIRLGW